MDGLDRILVPVDGSPASEKALDIAALLAKASGAAIDLLHVSYFDSETDDEKAGEVSWLPDSVMVSSGKTAEMILQEARERLPADVQVELHRATGRPAEKIVEFSDAHGAEMIVVGGRRLSLMKGLLLGSVSQKIMESANGRVLVVR